MGNRGWSKPSTPTATVTPTSKDLHWLAGILEGEGYFTCSPTSQLVGCEMTDKDILQKIQTFFGGTIDPKPRKRNNGKPIYRWRAYGTRARGIMLTLYSLLGVRRQKQIKLAMNLVGGK